MLAALTGAMVFAGWMLGIAPLRDLPGAIVMKTNAALGLLLAGTGLVLLIPGEAGRGRRWAGRICATIVLLLGALTFSEHLIGRNLGIDQLLATEPPGAAGAISPNRMGPLTALTFFLLGPALLLLGRQGRRAGRRALDQSFALLAVLVAMLPTIGYLYGADELYGTARYTGIAWPTAAALLAIGLGVLCARPQDGLMAAVTADDPGGRTIRLLLLPMILLPLGLGWLRLAGERYGLYEAAFGTATMMLIFIAIFSTLVYYAGRRVSQSAAVTEQQRQLLRESEQRRKIAEAVQAERQRFNDVLDMLPAYVVLLTPDYHVPFANRFFEERFGKSNGKCCFDYLFHRSEPCENCETYKVLKTGAPHRWEWTGPDGRNYDIHDFPFTDPDGSPLIMEVGLDITERKRAEAAVQAERQRFLDVLETLPVIVTLFRPNHRVEWVNRAYREALGDNVGQLCYASQFGRDKPCQECQAFTPLRTHQPHNWEWALPNGRTFDIYNFPFADADGSAMILEMDIDITDRRRAEAALQEANEKLEQRVAERTAALAGSEKQLRTTLESIGDGFFACDGDWRFVYVNAQAERILGIRREEVLGKSHWEVFPLAPGTPLEHEYRRAAAGEVRDFENFYEPWGRWFHNRCFPREGGGMSVFFEDITERKRAEETLLQAKAEAEAANVAKSQFLANMSHELRTPMNAILGMIDVALPKAGDPTVQDCLQTAKGSADLLLTLLNDLLDSAKIESGKLELESAPFSLRRMLDQITRVLSVRASEKGLCFYCRMPDETPDALVGDRMRLQQVLLNLAGNAIKFTDRGDVEVSVHALLQDSQACLEFAVRDTGIGIPPSGVERLFQPFAQADASMARRFGGTGLGLAISKSLVEMMAGRIWVESEMGKGSTFYFAVRLPVAKELPADYEAPVALPTVACGQLRILLVEDNPANQKLATYILQDRGHVVEIAGDGQEAVYLTTQNRYDVILMDVQMPGMNGLEATAAIRKKEGLGIRAPSAAWSWGLEENKQPAASDSASSIPNPQSPIPSRRVPIIAMTAHAMRGDRERCLAAGMDGYLPKPVNAQEMIGLVESLARGAVPVTQLATVASRPAATTPQATVAVFNPEEAIARCFNSRDMVREMIQCFFDEVGNLFPQMRAALEKGDLVEVGRLGHRMKGTVVYLGAQPAKEAALRVERFCKSIGGTPSEAEDAINALEHECIVLKAALSVHPLATEPMRDDSP
jgi:PAS domain S-box-containing protein